LVPSAIENTHTMTAQEALHTAARRYSQERAVLWQQRYSQLSQAGRDQFEGKGSRRYSEEALAIFPRYNVLDAILTEVERFVPNDFRTLEEAREILILSGRTAESLLTKAPQEETATHCMEGSPGV
jgi:hypothetical protein